MKVTFIIYLLLIWKTQTYKDTTNVSLPDAYNIQRLATANLGTRNSMPVSHVDSRNPTPRAITHWPPRLSRGNKWEWGVELILEPRQIHYVFRLSKQQLNLYTQLPLWYDTYESLIKIPAIQLKKVNHLNRHFIKDGRWQHMKKNSTAKSLKPHWYTVSAATTVQLLGKKIQSEHETLKTLLDKSSQIITPKLNYFIYVQSEKQ